MVGAWVERGGVAVRCGVVCCVFGEEVGGRRGLERREEREGRRKRGGV